MAASSSPRRRGLLRGSATTMPLVGLYCGPNSEVARVRGPGPLMASGPILGDTKFGDPIGTFLAGELVDRFAAGVEALFSIVPMDPVIPRDRGADLPTLAAKSFGRCFSPLAKRSDHTRARAPADTNVAP